MEILSHDLLAHFLDRAIMGFKFEAIRYSIGTLGVFFVLWLLLAPLLKDRKIRPHRRLNSQIKMELINSFRTICVFVALDIIVFDLAELGWFRKYSNISEYGLAWYYASIAIAIVLHDSYFYWAHRAMHSKRLYKLFHLTHHRSHNPTPFTAYSFAIPEAVVEYAYVPLMLLVLPIHDSALAIVLLVMIFKNALAHSGYEIFPQNTLDHWLLKHLTTVTHHDMHHERGNGNYGFYFTWWDRWMGTEHSNYRERFEKATNNKFVSRTKDLAQRSL